MDKKAMTAEMTRKYMENCLEDPALRRKSSAFTRERKLGAKRLLMIMLQRLVISLQLGLDRYYEKMEEDKQAGVFQGKGRVKPGICAKICRWNC